MGKRTQPAAGHGAGATTPEQVPGRAGLAVTEAGRRGLEGERPAVQDPAEDARGTDRARAFDPPVVERGEGPGPIEDDERLAADAVVDHALLGKERPRICLGRPADLHAYHALLRGASRIGATVEQEGAKLGLVIGLVGVGAVVPSMPGVTREHLA